LGKVRGTFTVNREYDGKKIPDYPLSPLITLLNF